MAVQNFAQGDLLATVGVEVSLVSTGAAGVYVLQVNRRNMAPGDGLQLRIKAATRELGDGANVDPVRFRTYADAPVDDDPDNLAVVETEPFSAPFGCEATLNQSTGVAVVFPWLLKRVG